MVVRVRIWDAFLLLFGIDIYVWEVLFPWERCVENPILNPCSILENSTAARSYFVHGEQVLQAGLLANCFEQLLQAIGR